MALIEVLLKVWYTIDEPSLDNRMGNRIGEFSLLFIANVGLKFVFEIIWKPF